MQHVKTYDHRMEKRPWYRAARETHKVKENMKTDVVFSAQLLPELGWGPRPRNGKLAMRPNMGNVKSPMCEFCQIFPLLPLPSFWVVPSPPFSSSILNRGGSQGPAGANWGAQRINQPLPNVQQRLAEASDPHNTARTALTQPSRPNRAQAVHNSRTYAHVTCETPQRLLCLKVAKSNSSLARSEHLYSRRH